LEKVAQYAKSKDQALKEIEKVKVRSPPAPRFSRPGLPK